MSVEIELKLHIAPELMNRLKRHPLLKTLSNTRASISKVYSVYFDTPDLELRQCAMALRLRRIGRLWLQTLKGGGTVKAGLHQRNEWETRVPGEELDFKALEAIGAKRLSAAARKRLRPVFVTDFSRTSRMLTFAGAEIELSLDSGEVRAGRASRPISELELELKSGKPRQLFKLALALLDIVPLQVEPVNKSEYGYRLYAKTKPGIAKARMPQLTQTMDTATALQDMLWSSLLHMQANVPGVLHKLDEEYLHQVRVALRRLRVILGMANLFRADDADLASLRQAFTSLNAELGRSRELDVFVTQTLAAALAHLPASPGLRSVLRSGERLRKQHHIQVQEALQTQSFQRLLLRFGMWMHGSYWEQGTNAGTANLSHFATSILQRRSRQLHKYGKRLYRANESLAEAGASDLHALRIACKKLRYSVEFFSALYAADRAKPYLAALIKLQDTLGVLNDIAVARRLLDELDNETSHASITLIRGWIERDYSERLTQLNQAWKKFSRLKMFWD